MSYNKPKLALISTYKVSCGIAAYAGYIEPHLNEFFSVTVFPLNRAYFQANDGEFCKNADAEVDRICQELEHFDVVSLQFEPGIYGAHPTQSLNRLKKLISASKYVILTFHTFLYGVLPTAKENTNKLSFAQKAIKRANLILSRGLRKVINNVAGRKYYHWHHIYRPLFDFIKATKNDQFYVIVHTKREARNVKSMYQINNVIDIPYNQLSKQEIAQHKQHNARPQIIKQFGLQESDKLVGFFGFLTPYKGVETAIRAMSYLPDNYKLLLFGTVHPSAITPNQAIDDYINDLLTLISANPNPNFAKRIIFCGKTDDHAFAAAINASDYVVFPYLEVAQTSSGPTVIALELAKKIVASNNHFYNEVAEYAKGCFLQFDIGNYLQLAQLIEHFPDSLTAPALEKYNHEYSIEKRAAKYWEAYQKMAGISHATQLPTKDFLLNAEPVN